MILYYGTRGKDNYRTWKTQNGSLWTVAFAGEFISSTDFHCLLKTPQGLIRTSRIQLSVWFCLAPCLLMINLSLDNDNLKYRETVKKVSDCETPVTTKSSLVNPQCAHIYTAFQATHTAQPGLFTIASFHHSLPGKSSLKLQTPCWHSVECSFSPRKES